MVGGVPFLVVVLLMVFFFGVPALAGLGGEGSGGCWRSGGVGGWPGRRCVGRKMGGAGEFVLRRVRSSSPDSVARRRMDVAAFYNERGGGSD